MTFAPCIYCGAWGRRRILPAVCGDCIGTFGRELPDPRAERALAEIGRDEFEKASGLVIP